MEIDKEQLAKYQAAKTELESSILQKLNAIRTRLTESSKETLGEQLQVLVMVNDELEDVLLNWEDIALPKSSHLADLDFDEDDY